MKSLYGLIQIPNVGDIYISTYNYKSKIIYVSNDFVGIKWFDTDNLGDGYSSYTLDEFLKVNKKLK